MRILLLKSLGLVALTMRCPHVLASHGDRNTMFGFVHCSNPWFSEQVSAACMSLSVEQLRSLGLAPQSSVLRLSVRTPCVDVAVKAIAIVVSASGSSSSSGSLPAHPVQRRDAPKLLVSAGAKRPQAIVVEAFDEERQSMRDELDTEVRAQSSKSSHDNTLQTWVRYHKLWHEANSDRFLSRPRLC